MSNVFSFFGQEIKPGTPQSFEIPFGEVLLHVSGLALGTTTPKGSLTRVYVHVPDEEDKEKSNKYVICTLVGKEKESANVDLNFSEDVAFSVESEAGENVTVHVTGYINLISDEEDDYAFLDEDMSESEKNEALRRALEEDDEDDEEYKPDLNESSESAHQLEELSDEEEVEQVTKKPASKKDTPKKEEKRQVEVSAELDEDLDEGEEVDEETAQKIMDEVEALEDKLGREATDEEIQKIMEKHTKGAAKEEPKAATPSKKQPQQKQTPQKQTPSKQDNNEKKRKQDDALGNNKQQQQGKQGGKKNKKNKKNKH
ncbi:hypothetical protein ABK040_010454 [Willaertia magna]